MVRHGTHGRSTAARPPHPLTHKKTRLPRTPTCSPRPHPFPEKPPRLCPAPKNCRRRTFVAPQNPRRRAAPARGPRTVVCLHRPNRNAPQQARPLLVGRAASPRSRRHWLAALPPTQARGPCSWAAHRRLPPPPKRNAPQPVCPLLVGQTGVTPEPNGTGRRPRRPTRHPKNRSRRQAPARGPVAVCPLHRPNRNAPQPARPLLVGRDRRRPGAEGTGRRPCRPLPA